jgi:NADH:ubiquinone oxidoreductase subunit 6 (subunit J)
MEQLLAAAGGLAALLGAVMVLVVAVVALAGLTALTVSEPSVPRWTQSRYVRTALATAMALIVVVSLSLMAGPAPDIVYKNF